MSFLQCNIGLLHLMNIIKLKLAKHCHWSIDYLMLLIYETVPRLQLSKSYDESEQPEKDK